MTLDLEAIRAGQQKDLRGAYLQGANLTGADLRGANLWGANLWGANLREADLREATLRGADLRGATLWGATLREADLREATLRGADLARVNLQGAILPTGETWEDYCALVVPALCKVTGKPLGDVAQHWNCHTWQNCPMAYVFGVGDVEAVPLLYRPRVAQFIQFFDAGLLPTPTTGKD